MSGQSTEQTYLCPECGGELVEERFPGEMDRADTCDCGQKVVINFQRGEVSAI